MCKEKSNSEKMISGIIIFSTVGMILFWGLYFTYSRGIFLTLGITFGTIWYHFVMRLVVGLCCTKVGKRWMDDKDGWFRERKFEEKIYRKIRIKKWKNKLPTYHPENFSVQNHTLEELVQTMCISEIGHGIMAILSYLPLFFSILFGEFFVFFVTSFLAAGVDFVFLMVQRYNRFRIEKILGRKKVGI